MLSDFLTEDIFRKGLQVGWLQRIQSQSPTLLLSE